MTAQSAAFPNIDEIITVTVEFTGLGRAIAGGRPAVLRLPPGTNYHGLIEQLAALFPGLVGVVIAEDRLTLLNANLFSRNGEALLMPDMLDGCPENGDRLTVISIIVGGGQQGSIDAVRAARLHPRAKLPTRKHPQDAGLDIYLLEAAHIGPGQLAILHTGVTLQIPNGLVGLLKPKGRSNHLLGAGVIDAGYQGEILVKVINPLSEPLDFSAGDAVAQLLLVPVFTPEVVEVDAAEIHALASERGATGGIVEQQTGDS